MHDKVTMHVSETLVLLLLYCRIVAWFELEGILKSIQSNPSVIPERGIPAGLQGPPVIGGGVLCPFRSPLPHLNAFAAVFVLSKGM